MKTIITSENFKDIKEGDIIEFPHNGKRIRVSKSSHTATPINNSYFQYTGTDRYEVVVEYEVALGCFIIGEEKKVYDFDEDCLRNKILDHAYYMAIGKYFCLGKPNNGDSLSVIKELFIAELRKLPSEGLTSFSVMTEDGNVIEPYLEHRDRWRNN